MSIIMMIDDVFLMVYCSDTGLWQNLMATKVPLIASPLIITAPYCQVEVSIRCFNLYDS